ncbi:MAG: hypothetical protein WBP81_03265 [Solirubrobacteraceae bacterium]
MPLECSDGSLARSVGLRSTQVLKLGCACRDRITGESMIVSAETLAAPAYRRLIGGAFGLGAGWLVLDGPSTEVPTVATAYTDGCALD